MSQTKQVILPNWLDKFLFQDLSATYAKKNKNLIVLKWDDEDIRSYLGTYFPRSFAESYRIFSSYLNKFKSKYEFQKSVSLFDFGCGTGGELVGFIIALTETLPNIKTIELKALDGNVHSLRYLEAILDKLASITNLTIKYRLMPCVIDDLYDMKIITDVITERYDFVISFKAICEFASMKQFEDRNPYEHILNTFLPKITENGLICIADITTFNQVTNEWLTTMLDKASKACDVQILDRNQGYNEEFFVSHSMKKNDKSKIAWRLYKPNNINHEERLDD